jgi:low affinity Fe/Cu permease
MNTIPRKFDSFLDAIQAIIMSFLVKLGPFFVALMPALFTAYAIFHTFQGEAGPKLAFFFAVVVGLAMETVGIVATHTAISLYNAQEEGTIQPVKFKLMVWLVPIYVIGVAAVVGFSENAFTPLVKGLGIASPALTCVVYVAVALARDIRRVQAKQDDENARQDQANQDKLKWEQEKERLEIELKHKEKLARIEAKTRAQENPQTRSQTTQNGHNSPPLRLPRSEWRENAREILAQNPQISGAELGRLLGASERTGQNIMLEIQTNGTSE